MNSRVSWDRRVVFYALAIFGLALAAGMPSIGGAFLAGDDYHLVRNHVLVNHPSLAHAIEILTIVHRDLYQPIPLLSFSLDFAIIQGLGLHPTAEGDRAGAWVFHLTNVLIHGVNAALVLLVLRRLTRSVAIAAIAAAIFAVHPLAVEPVAWLNGRMFMLSTLFTLWSVIAFDRWNGDGRVGSGVVVVLLTLCAHMSKISVALPILMLMFPVLRGRRPGGRWWKMWICVAVITALFTAFAVYSSAESEMFDRAAEQQTGPAIPSTLLALGQYFRHFLAPIGLCHWYPPPRDIGWANRSVLSAAITVALVMGIAVAMLRRTRVGILGLIWFLAVVAPTLPIVPVRRALAADRYVYLANVGLEWIVAAAVVALFGTVRQGRGLLRFGVAAACVTAGAALTATTWRTQVYYRDNIASAERIIQCNPDEPSVYQSAAWAYNREGEYEAAIEIALEDLRRHPKEMACVVYQVVGMSQFGLGRYDDALESLARAIAADPRYGKCYSRMGSIQAHLGRFDEAIANYEHAVEIMPFYNPVLVALGSVYRKVGRPRDAVRVYEQALQNNPYDVPAHLALAEIDLHGRRFTESVERLQRLLSWMPENRAGRTNLGLAQEGLGRPVAAIEAYETAIERDPHAVIATINLANLHEQLDHPARARRVFERQLPKNDRNLALLIAYYDFASRWGGRDAAVTAILRAHNRVPTDGSLRAWASFVLAASGRWPEARRLDGELSDGPGLPAVALVTRTLASLHDDAAETAIGYVERLLAMDTPEGSELSDRLTGLLNEFATVYPDNPWPYYLTAKVLIARNEGDFAALALAEFSRRCPTVACDNLAAALAPQ